MNLRRWGVLPGYFGRDGWHPAPRASLDAVLRVMGATGLELARPPAGVGPTRADEPAGPAPSHASGIPSYPKTWVLRVGESRAVESPSELRLEDGTVLAVEAYLPRDLPLGYHELVSREDGHRTRLIVSPGRCHLPERLRTWGWAVQLYALYSKQSWGIGDFADLEELARWSARDLGAGMLLVSPLHAPMPTLPQQPSPYYPSSRLYRNPIHLRIENVPGAQALGPLLDELRARGTALLSDPRIDRNAVFALKMKALEALWTRFYEHAAEFEPFCASEGAALEMYATFCALAEFHPPPWQSWPAELRDPGSPEVRRFAERHRDRVRFHQWLQWLIDGQLRAAGREIPLVGDLAVGIDPSGADAWTWQDLYAEGMEVGAPPDEFNTQGQKWGLLPFAPNRLTSAGYEPFVRIVRAALRHMGGLRLDHVMGLFRLYWIPSGTSPREGVYVRYPALDLLDIVALESERAHAYIVGEDLGTVEDEVRRELTYRRSISYRVMWFERAAPAQYPTQALATVTTHDLPTIPGLWTGSDLVAQRSAGLSPNEDGTRALRSSLAQVAGAPRDAPVSEVVLKTYAALAKAPSMLLSATLEDALGFEPRPNMPGTTDEYPSWCIRLPKAIDEIQADPGPQAVARALKRDPV
jgi:4-alpha-glucanotransferase